MQSSIPDRYENNPMLVIAENYILDTIGQLPPDKEKRLSEMINRTFGGKDWRATVRKQLDLPPDTAQQLKTTWHQRQEEAEAMQQDLAPEDFAREIADALFDGRGAV